MKDFKISNNLIVEQKRMHAVCEVLPFDVALLSKEDRQMFYTKIRQAYDILPSRVQIIVVKEEAKVRDYTKHFESITAETNKAKDSLVLSYIHELSALIEAGEVLILKYYFIFSIGAETKDSRKFIERYNSLSDKVSRFTGVLAQAGVETRQLTGENLINFIKQQVRT